MYDYLVVGAGFAGSVLAERLANELNKKVLVIDKRNHIAGNMYDYFDEHGVMVHKYGPHIFHTNSNMVVDYLSMFTEWSLYEHRVLASVDGQKVPLPINMDTINKLYHLSLSESEVASFYDTVKETIDPIKNSEDVIIAKVGKELYEKFFKHYTKKQWDLWPHELDSSVCARIPIRTNRDGRYFSDKYQVMPKLGYTRMFERMLDHPNIHVMLQTNYKDIERIIPYHTMIYTGPIDAYFNYVYGKLPYRSLKFVFENHKQDNYQEVGTVNYPNSYDFTRITEFKHLTNQKVDSTSIVYEYPTAEGDPYYPIPRDENTELYKKYKEEAEKLENVIFAGRLATYKYYNMDQVVAQALTIFDQIKHSTN